MSLILEALQEIRGLNSSPYAVYVLSGGAGGPWLILCFFLMIFHLRVDGPDVVLVADPGDDVIDCRHSGQHGVVLIVVLVHSVSANQVQIVESIEKLADDVESVIGTEIGRVGFGNADHMGIGDVG